MSDTEQRATSGSAFRCSDAARARGDRWVGTAPPARHWFLVEQQGGWGPNAWAGLDLPGGPKGELEELLEAARARLMLIRRPGRGADVPAAPRWCAIRAAGRDPQVIWGHAADAGALLAAARLFARPDTAVDRFDPSGGDGPEILLVCTHGRKDVCCAVRGRPVAARAAELWPEATWECSHTGGDRFAGNLVVLPDGACYGGLDAGDVETVVTAHVQGRIDAAHLRGPTGHSARAQAAMVEAWTRFGPLPFSGVSVVAEAGSAQRWRVRLEVLGVGMVEVTGHVETSEPHRLTCGAGVPKLMRLPVVDTVAANGDKL